MSHSTGHGRAPAEGDASNVSTPNHGEEFNWNAPGSNPDSELDASLEDELGEEYEVYTEDVQAAQDNSAVGWDLDPIAHKEAKTLARQDALSRQSGNRQSQLKEYTTRVVQAHFHEAAAKAYCSEDSHEQIIQELEDICQTTTSKAVKIISEAFNQLRRFSQHTKSDFSDLPDHKSSLEALASSAKPRELEGRAMKVEIKVEVTNNSLMLSCSLA